MGYAIYSYMSYHIFIHKYFIFEHCPLHLGLGIETILVGGK